MTVQWFRILVFLIAAMGCVGLANRIFAAIVRQVKDNEPRGSQPKDLLFFFPWTGPEVLTKHRRLYPHSWLRLWLITCVICLFLFVLIAGSLLPDPRA